MGGVKIYGLGLVKRNKVKEMGWGQKSTHLCTIWIFKHWNEIISNIFYIKITKKTLALRKPPPLKKISTRVSLSLNVSTRIHKL